MAGDFKYEIQDMFGVISESGNNWTKELNLISWNGGKPKYDLRDWGPEHEKMGKGITLTQEELESLYDIIKQILESQSK